MGHEFPVMSNDTVARLSKLLEEEPEQTPSAKLLIALNLAETGLALKKQNLIRMFPKDSEQQLADRWNQWLLHRAEAPLGDCPGLARSHL